MQDFRRLQQGRLESTYVAKHPTAEEAAEGIASGAFAPETRLAHLEGPLTPGFVADERYGDAEQQSLSRLGRQFRAVELAGELEAARIQAAHDMAVEQRDAALADNRRLNEELAGIRRRKVVRLTDKVARGLRRPPHDTAAD
jgi:hypothetical protein